MTSIRKEIRNILKETYDSNSDKKQSVKLDLSSQKIMLGNKVIGQLEVFDKEVSTTQKYLILDKIFIDKDYRGKGYAEEAFRQLIHYADAKNIIITLTPDDVWGSNKNKLIKWYKSLGFIMNKGKNKDFQTMQLMYKLPSKLEEMIGFKQFTTTTSRLAYPGKPSEFPNPSDYDQFGNQVDDISK